MDHQRDGTPVVIGPPGVEPRNRRASTRRLVLLGVPLFVVVLTGFRWYRYVSNTDSPYDEVGITHNKAMPGPINSWGCAKLKTTFANSLPPYGCAAGDGTQWR